MGNVKVRIIQIEVGSLETVSKGLKGTWKNGKSEKESGPYWPQYY